MGEPHFTDDDDLPRTLRRERDAREREMRNRELQERARRERDAAAARDAEAGYDNHYFAGNTYADAPRHAHRAPDGGTVVERLQIPFLHLTWFFTKAVFAAIPALLILAVLLWFAGKGLALAFPNLARMQILIHFPK